MVQQLNVLYYCLPIAIRLYPFVKSLKLFSSIVSKSIKEILMKILTIVLEWDDKNKGMLLESYIIRKFQYD